MQIVVKSPYPKGWLDYDGQVEKLRNRGLGIADAEFARQFLAYSNYYRFTGYCLRFQHKDESGERIFNNGVSFSDIVDIYEIDKALRDCIADALGAVEISFRSAVAYHFAETHGAFGHTVKDNFDRRFIMLRTDSNGRPLPSLYEEWHEGLISETKRSNELFVKHFEAKYLQFPDIPIWTALEIVLTSRQRLGVIAHNGRSCENPSKSTAFAHAMCSVSTEKGSDYRRYPVLWRRILCGDVSRICSVALSAQP